METPHPGRAAAGAALSALVVIGVLGNQWVSERLDRRAGGLGDFLRQISPFRWRVSEFPSSTALKIAPYAAIVVTVVLIALLTVPLARTASGFGLLAGVVGVTFVASFIGAFILSCVSYRPVFGDSGDPRGAGQLMWSLNNSAPTIGLWALLVGVLGGLAALAAAGRQVMYSTTPVSGEPWGGQGYRGPNDTQAMWIPTQGGLPPAPPADPAWVNSTGWTSAPGGDATMVDLPRTEGPPTR